MVIKRRKLIKSQQVMEWEDYLYSQIKQQTTNWTVLQGPVYMEMNVVFPDNRRRDVHNLLDVVCDCLQGTVYKDDSQIIKLVCTKQVIKGTYSMELVISNHVTSGR